MSVFHVYEMSPVDNGWFLFKTVEEVLSALCEGLKHQAENCITTDTDIFCYEYPDPETFIKQYNQSRTAARKAGWEGDMREGPVVVPVVQDADCCFGFMWKQDSNGTTYVVIPVKNDRLLKVSYSYQAVRL
jgi:hypothetical protein